MDQNVTRSKKSSRLNPKKEEKVELQIDPSWKPTHIDIVIQHEDRLGETPKIYRNYKIYLTSEGDIVTAYLVQQLINQKVLREDTSVSFYDEKKDIFVYSFTVPKSPLDFTSQDSNHRFISSKFINEASQTLKIKLRSKKKLIIQALIQEQREKYQEAEENEKGHGAANKGQKQKKIGEVVEKVALWRKFYTGFYDQNGNYIQKPLEAAAQEVGIAKKTLDDYLLQIRNGKKYGFNFNEKFNCKIGELRAFVRDEKKKETGGR